MRGKFHVLAALAGMAFVLTSAGFPTLAAPPQQRGLQCDDFQAYGLGIQDDPGGVFRGTLWYTIVAFDANGVPQPTGEVIETEFTSWALGLLDGSNGRTTNAFKGVNVDNVDIVQFDEFTVVPRSDGTLGLLDVGDIRAGEGRWNCGRAVGGINPMTGEPLSSISFFDQQTPGRAEIILQGRFCDCDD